MMRPHNVGCSSGHQIPPLRSSGFRPRVVRRAVGLPPLAVAGWRRRLDVVSFRNNNGRKRAETSKKPTDPETVHSDVLAKVEFNSGGNRGQVTALLAYQGLAWNLREHLMERMIATQNLWREKDPKFVYYLSAEFLMGRSLLNTIQNLELYEPYAQALKMLGYNLETLAEKERDASLGNGGLGRLAACFLDAMATMNLPGWGYGIRYKYGMFKQIIKDGEQMEVPDVWLTDGNPWEVRRPDVVFPVSFGGKLKKTVTGSHELVEWIPDEQVIAMAYDVPIPGFNTQNTGNLRLWESLPVNEFDLDAFNKGDILSAYNEKGRAEAITSVLYPNDSTPEGKALRLKQQYFFVSASLQDVLARFKKVHGNQFDLLPEKACFQLNDTHPTIGIAEMVHLLVDKEGLDWEAAWGITTKVFAFTNHTIMPEALEKWPVKVMREFLPRHMEIIETIDTQWQAFLEEKLSEMPKAEKQAAIDRMAIVHPNQWNKEEMLVNMAHLAVVGSHTVNGVAQIHSDIIKSTIFKDFHGVFPLKFQNKTNGVTPRRWLVFSNTDLATLITEALGTQEWMTNCKLLEGLKPFAEDAEFRKKWSAVKRKNKERLGAKIRELTGDDVDTSSMFDIQIKRIHEYKRQFLNVLSVIRRYNTIKAMTPEERKSVVPRVCVIAGKAASSYERAKDIIRLVGAVGDTINTDPEVRDLLRLYFLPDYNVSLAEVIIPAADLSQHISTAGTEASGTSNMKFQMNGSLILGTMDGANIEIAEEIAAIQGPDAKVGDGLFIFGVDAKDVPKLRKERKEFKTDPRWDEIMDMIKKGTFGNDKFEALVDSVNDMTVGNDWFLLANDFATYLDVQDEVDAMWKNQDEWVRRSILYTASSGKFSSDRTISQYAEEIWDVQPLAVA
ncbi:unnamed protein product [Ostreobium quekettii]|uniref:Alpha-1,4 glucan phosphorylase n=1 Tax=Ostreobium quekettii TaxID=121088 RepID=A0A8S1JBA6_9CHLO|nr:unnamed protein product [Ostreobium quekettii]|eukprot:evm.model.scf_496.4 EVM.evm.TU.scf_496.4   scf_496:21167-31997(+)